MRYLLDIILLVAATLGLDRALAGISSPDGPAVEVLFAALAKLPVLAVAWILIRLRGDTLKDIGLKSPDRWWRTFVTGAALAVILFFAVYILDRAGFHRNLGQFSAVKGNLGLTGAEICYSFVGAGFYEEFMFRGFLFQGLAMFLGATRNAWLAASVVQAILFGFAHAYQNAIGVILTGMIGLIMAGLFLACRRNLWPPIVAHGIYDASRFTLFYFQGVPT